jgi:HEAT repeat protein/Na+/melibiose symporter-like transporter
MIAELTNAEKLRKIHWNTALNAINTVFAQLTFFGAAFPLFLAELNFSNTEIGFLLSLIPFAALVALFVAPAAARWGYKRTFVTFFGVRKAVTTFLLLVPWVQAQFGTQAVLIYVTVVVLAFSLVRSIAETAIWPWAQEFIPNSIRGTYTAVNDIVCRLTGVAAIALSSLLLALPLGMDRYILMFGIALVFGWGAVWAASHIPGGRPVTGEAGERVSYRGLLGVLRDRNFTLYLAGLSIVTLGTGPIASFLPLFMEREIGLSESHVVLLQIGGMVGGLTATYLMGWASDRYGSKPVLLSGLYLKCILPVAWLLMPRNSDLSLPAALVISAVSGIADIAWAIGLIRLLFVGVVPPEKKTGYMAMYYAVAGLAGGLSSVIGGRILDATAGISGQFLFITLDPFTPLFVGGIVLTVVSVFVFNTVKADSRVSVGEFAGLFTHGNPVLALESMYRYYRARDERTTVMLTERMGVTKSPLTVEELLEALHDPRFNVRFEAVISIARMDSDPRLIDALAHLVEGTELSLSAISAWALGRMGDESALPALRKGLNSEYRSIRGQCARALATLGDTSVIPLLLERLPTETDKGLRVAYASALGKLQSAEAIDALFQTLDDTENEGARMELALSIARMTGHEQPFIRLLRQARHDPGTTVSQALSGLRRKLNALENPELVRLADEAAHLFARDDFAAGTPLLVELVGLLPNDICPERDARIIAGCAARLRVQGSAHREYLILTLHTLDFIFHHQSKEPAP